MAAPGPWLVGDIGGTNARFGTVREAGAPVTDVRGVRTADFASVQAAALHYLSALAPTGRRPLSVCLAVATAIDGDTAKMTNSPWVISRSAVATTLQSDTTVLINDFEALALALPNLAHAPDGAVTWFGAGRPDARRSMAVIGPGTGLGVASCIPAADGWIAVPCEGGHVTASAFDDFEGAVLAAARREQGHISAERLLSGIGLPTLYRAVCSVRGSVCRPLSAEDISHQAQALDDADCRATIDCFCAMLGGFAGNVALTTGARGGVFIAGGIAQKLGSTLIASSFRNRFESKGRLSSYLREIPTGLLMTPHAALDGAARALMQL